MSHPHALPENTAQDLESGFPFNGWELSGEISPKETPLFDGKIIARMPDLGSESFLHNSEDAKASSFRASSFWGSIGSSIASMIQGTAHSSPAGKHFLHRFTAIGCVVLLCGIGILLLEREETVTENTPGITEFVSESVEIPVRDGSHVDSFVYAEPASVPVAQSKPEAVVIPVAPAESVAAVSSVPPTPPIVHPPKPAESVWNRPVGDSYSPWNIVPREPESFLNEVATGEMPLTPMPPTPMPPAEMVAMAPMLNLSMPVSPHEQLWLAQSEPPVQRPTDPFYQAGSSAVQGGNSAVQGMVPALERRENAQGGADNQNNIQRSAPPPYPQYVPSNAVQGVHTQFSQYAPAAVPPNMPIPSGVSTLPTQGGYYPQQRPNGTASSVPPPSEYYNVPPNTYRRVY